MRIEGSVKRDGFIILIKIQRTTTMTEQVSIFDQIEQQVTEPAPLPVSEEPVFADIEEEP